MAGKKGQNNRFWSDEEKVSICVQTCAPGVSVAQVARRYAMNTNLIHKWLRDPKFAPGPEIIKDEVAETACFLPVEIAENGNQAKRRCAGRTNRAQSELQTAPPQTTTKRCKPS
jgi:transposase